MAFLISSLGPAVASERAGAAALEAFKSAICLLSAVIVLSWPRTAIFSVSFSVRNFSFSVRNAASSADASCALVVDAAEP